MQTSAGQDFTSLFLTVSVVMVLICLAAFAILKWVLPRLVRSPLRRKDSLVQVIAHYGLAPRQALYVIKVGNRYLAVGSSDKGLSLLTALEASDLPEEWR